MRRARVDVVEHAGDLHAGGVDQLAAGVVGGHDELAGEQLARGALPGRGQLERVEGGQVREVARHGAPDGVRAYESPGIAPSTTSSPPSGATCSR